MINNRAISRRTTASKRKTMRRMFLEGLEGRCLMAGLQDFDVSIYKNGPLAKAGDTAIDLVREYKAWESQRAIGNGPLTFRTNNALPITISGGTVEMEILTSGNFQQGIASVSKLGVEVGPTSAPDNMITGMVPISQLESVAKLPNVVAMRTLLKPITHAVDGGSTPPDGAITNAGAVVNQADAAQNGPAARAAYSASGAGVKVGVLSDSVNRFAGGLADSQATHDLAAVQVIQDGPTTGEDEGRAMLELVHDIAPSSPLAFASAFVGGQTGFANNIDALRNAGSKVIVDDISYFAEPMFQPGVIDLAIKRAVDANIPYFSSAGNSGLGYEQAIAPGSWSTGVYDFNASPAITDSRMQVTFAGKATVILQWDEPYNGLPVAGKVDNDLDLFLLNSADQVVASSTNNNLSTQTPVEIMSVPAGTYNIAINKFSGSAPGRIKLVSFGGAMTTEYGTNKSSTFGHNAGPWTIGVGAVSFSDAPPFSSNPTIPTESYSSAGPSTYVFDGVTPYRDMASDIIFKQPFISGVDNVNTTFFIPGNDSPKDPDNFPNFSGTSAAAPNVAAVAALMKQKFPTATVGQIAQALAETARPVNGTAAGVWDSRGGYGLVNAKTAMDRLSAIKSVGQVVDNSDANSVKTGTWTKTTAAAGYRGDYLVHAKNTTVQRVDFTFNYLADGSYNIYTTYVADPSRATNVRYELSDGDQSEGAVAINQRVAPSGLTADGKTWKLVKRIVVTQGVVNVSIVSSSTGTVAADAVLLRLLPPAAITTQSELLAGSLVPEGEAAPLVENLRGTSASQAANAVTTLVPNQTAQVKACVAVQQPSAPNLATQFPVPAERKQTSLAALDSIFDQDLWQTKFDFNFGRG